MQILQQDIRQLLQPQPPHQRHPPQPVQVGVQPVRQDMLEQVESQGALACPSACEALPLPLVHVQLHASLVDSRPLGQSASGHDAHAPPAGLLVQLAGGARARGLQRRRFQRQHVRLRCQLVVLGVASFGHANAKSDQALVGLPAASQVRTAERFGRERARTTSQEEQALACRPRHAQDNEARKRRTISTSATTTAFDKSVFSSSATTDRSAANDQAAAFTAATYQLA